MTPHNQEILRLALPSILANITVPIVGMVDIAVAGHLGTGLGTAAFIGGISVGSMLFDLIYWNFGFVRASTGGLTAQAYGREDNKDCARLLIRSVTLALALSLLVLLLQWPVSSLAFLVVDCSPEVKEFALKYFFIRIWAAPATVSLMAFKGWFIGMQDSVSSMFVDLIVNFVNIAGSIVLALGFGSWEGLGFAGIALGTVLAQYSGLLYSLLAVSVKYGRRLFKGFTREDAAAAFHGQELRRFFSMNTDLFVRSLGFIAIYIGYTIISARFGDLMLASAAIMMKLLMLFSFFVDGFAYAGQALTGKLLGRKEPAKVRRMVRVVFNWSIGIGLLFIVLYAAAGVPMLRVMTSESRVVDACRQFIPWLLLMPLLGCAAFTWDGIYEGATASRWVRNAMLWAAAAFFTVWAAGKLLLDGCLTERVADYNAAAIHVLMAAYFAHLLARTVYLTVCRRSLWSIPGKIFEDRNDSNHNQ